MEHLINSLDPLVNDLENLSEELEATNQERLEWVVTQLRIIKGQMLSEVERGYDTLQDSFISDYEGQYGEDTQ